MKDINNVTLWVNLKDSILSVSIISVLFGNFMFSFYLCMEEKKF